MGSSDPKIYKLPQDLTNETLETPDLEKFRQFDPRVSNVQAITGKHFDQERGDIADSYGAYTGLPTVAAQRLAGLTQESVGVDEATAAGENVNVGNAARSDQLEALNALTRRTRSSGFTSSLGAPGQSLAAAAIGAGASIGAAAIPTIVAV